LWTLFETVSCPEKQNEAAVRRFLVALESSGALDDLNEICSTEVAQGWRANMERFPFTDRTFTIDDLVPDDAKVAVLWTNTGTHSSLYAGISSTGKQTTGHGSAFFTFEGGNIVNVVSYFDAEDLFRQLGATIDQPVRAPSGRCSSTRGLYSTSWMRPSKVRCSIISRATSG